MYFCYLDESGTPQTGAETSHFVLLGLAIPACAWHPKDKRVNAIKSRYGLQDVEVHIRPTCSLYSPNFIAP